MPTVDIAIGKRMFQLVCDEGQEDHLQGLASGISERMEEISKVASGTSENMLLVMASLMLQDELNASESKIQRMKEGGDAGDLFAQGQDIDEAVSDAVMTIAEYIEELADRIEAA